MKWDDVKAVVKWTLENARHLEPIEAYLIGKEIDNCHAFMQKRAQEPDVQGDASNGAIYNVEVTCRECGKKSTMRAETGTP